MTSPKGTILITGSNGGLGSAIAEHIATHPELAAYHGLYTVRDPTATTTADLTSKLQNTPSHAHDIVALDLTNLDSVRDAAASINGRVASGDVPPIRALILNAGFQDFGKQAWTDEELDKTFSANYLGHWLLTLLLLKSLDKTSGRIVLVGSQSHDPQDKRNDSTGAFVDEKFRTFLHDEASFEAIAKGTWSSAKDDPSWRSGFRRYGAAKFFLIAMMHELQRRLNRDPDLREICVLGVDPGTMSTGLQRQAPWFIRVVLFQVVMPFLAWLMPDGGVRTTQKSAFHVLQAAIDVGPGLGQYPKDVYLDGLSPRETSAESRDAGKCALIWKETVRYAHLQAGETILASWQ